MQLDVFGTYFSCKPINDFVLCSVVQPALDLLRAFVCLVVLYAH